MSRGLDRFPDSFNAAAFQSDRNEEKLREARAMVLERYTKFVQAQKPYFQIDLTNYTDNVRVKLITEINQRFKGIGYRGQPPMPDHRLSYDKVLQMLMLNDPIKPQEIKCNVIRLTRPDQAGNFTHFFIALTEQADQELERYTWIMK
jgi:hypothetical protein